MRNWTAAEEAAYLTNSPQLAVKVEVRDSGGTLREWTNIDGNGRNIVAALEWGDSLSNGGMDGELVFDFRPAEHDNLSPFWGSGRFSDYLDVVRDVVVSVKVTPPGADLTAFTWVEVFRATTDDVDLSGDVGVLPLRDLIYAELMDGFITSNKRYATDDGTTDVDDVAAAILADFDKQANTLSVPVANAFQLRKAYVQQKMPIFRALQDLYFPSGWDLRPLWNGSAFELTAYNPDRTPSGTSHTFPASHILKFPQFSVSAANIRNWVKVYFGVDAIIDEYGNDTRTFIERLDETSPANDPTGSVVASSSIDKYKWRFLSFAEASTSLIRSQADAGQFADYAIADLAQPTFLGSVELAYLFWPVEVNDYYTFESDGLRFGSDQDFAVTAFRHRVDFSAGRHVTTLSLQGKPSLGKEQYFKRASGPGMASPVDDVAPQQPVVTLRQTPLGVTAVVDVTNAFDYDQVLFFVGPVSGFTPSAANLVQSSRSREYYHVPKSGQVREWLKVQLRDRTGNISTASDPLALVAKKTETAQLSQPLQAKTQLGFYADAALAGYGVVPFNHYMSGEFLGDYNLATGRFFARQGGTYRVAMSGKLSTSMTEGTDFYLCVMRDPDGDNEEVARTTVQTGASGDIAFSLEGFVPLDQDDEFQVEVCDPGGGSFSAITFRGTYTTLKIELVGTQSRTQPYPFLEADPEFIDHGPAGTFSATAASCNAVFRCANGEILFTNGAAGDEHPAMLHRNVVDTAKAREISVSTSTDYFFQGVAEDEDRNLYLASSKVDATAHYALRRYGQDLAQDWVSTDLGSTIAPQCVAYAPSADAPRVYLGTLEPTTAGRVYSINKTTGAAVANSADLGGSVNSLARLHPEADGGGLVVAQLASTTAPDIVALEAGDVTTEVWRIELNTDVTPAGTSTNRGELKTSPERDQLYAIGGQQNPALYAINAAGEVVWSVDVGTASTLADITGCLSIDVHPTTGDVAVLAVYDNTDDGTSDLDCVVYDREGNARWSWRELYDVDPADDPLWTSSETGHRIAFATDGAIWVSGGASASIAKVFRPYAEIPANPPSILASELLADMDAEALGLTNGAPVSVWSSKRGTGGWRFENDASAEQPTMRGKWDAGTVDSVARVRTEFAAVEFDGTERLIGNLEDATLNDGAICVLVCEPVDATGDYFSAYTDAGSAASPSVELVNDTARLTININVDVGDDTVYDAPSLAGLQVVGVRASDHTTAGVWVSNAQPNQTAAISGTDASPDNAPRVRLGQAGNSSGDWFAGWVYRWIWVKPAQFSASKVCSVIHWARQYYRVDEVAVEDAQNAPGNTITYVSKTQYFTGGEEIVSMSALGLSGQCVIGHAIPRAANPYMKLIPDDGGAAVWTSSASQLYTSAARSGGFCIDADGGYIYAAVRGDGTVGSAGQSVLARYALSDGSLDYMTTSSWGGSGNGYFNCNGIDVDVDGDEVYFMVLASGDELKRHTASTGAQINTSGYVSSTGTEENAGCLSPNKDYYCATGYNANCEYAQFALPMTGTAAKWVGYSGQFRLDGTNSTNDFVYFASTEEAGQVVPARDGTNRVYICAGNQSNADHAFIAAMDCDAGATYGGDIDFELDAITDSGLTPGTYNHVLSIAVDRWGYIYALVTNASNVAGSYETDVVRYQPDGTFDLSFAAEGVTLPTYVADDYPTRIAVDEDDTVYVGDQDGYVWVWTQT